MTMPIQFENELDHTYEDRCAPYFASDFYTEEDYMIDTLGYVVPVQEDLDDDIPF